MGTALCGPREFVMHFLCGDGVSPIRLLGRFKAPKMIRSTVDAYSRVVFSISAVELSPLKAGRAVPTRLCISHILRFGCLSKIAETIVGLHHVGVIHLILRPHAVDIKPFQSMSEIMEPMDADPDVATRVAFTSDRAFLGFPD